MHLPAGDIQFPNTRLVSLLPGYVSEIKRWQQFILVFRFSLEP